MTTALANAVQPTELTFPEQVVEVKKRVGPLDQITQEEKAACEAALILN